MRGISLELYRIFYEIGQTGNLTRAAENLYVTQPNISVALKSLEGHLRAQLCVRAKSGVSLTREGRVLFEELSAAFEHIALAETKVEKLVHLDSGSISISASDTICHYYLMPYIKNFTAQYPHIRFEITNRTSIETVEMLRKGQVDYGFINLPYTDDAISTTQCIEMRDVLIGGPAYRSLADTGLHLRDVVNYPLVMLEQKSNSRRCLDRFFASHGITLSPILELGSFDLVVGFVQNNIGLAFIPYELCGHFIDSQTVYRIALDVPPPPRGLGLVELKGAVCSHAAERFKESVLAAGMPGNTPEAGFAASSPRPSQGG